jgi:hypothetical protein
LSGLSKEEDGNCSARECKHNLHFSQVQVFPPKFFSEELQTSPKADQ